MFSCQIACRIPAEEAAVRETQTEPDIAARSEEIDFPFHDLFISHTDKRGVIISGNEVFRRVSGFDWSELVGAPHRLIRHDDMPCGVFQLFWDRLKAGKGVGCYVKNKTKDNRSYWVYAYVTPIADGYVSTRQRPSSDLFEKVREIYAGLRRREREENLTPEASRDALLETLAQAGFANYEDFMACSAVRETTGRIRALGRTLPYEIREAANFATVLRPFRQGIDELERLFTSIHDAPTNIRILAAQLEQNSGPIGIISNNHTTLSQEVVASLADFRRETEAIFDAVNNAVFNVCLARILTEMVEKFETETECAPGLDFASEANILAGAAEVASRQARDHLFRMARQSRRFANATADMKRKASALDVTRIMCKIENARNPDPTGGLGQILDNLEKVQGRIAQRLSAMAKASRTITSDADLFARGRQV
ncbi:MAG: hypothetical protein D6751_10660 [Deltaproteobacteria bacterium]|nr:MAG: hypothetical protein D6751_10660 [Deltaproteobacteria bacterium]